MDETGWANIQSIANDPEHKDRLAALKLLAAYAVGNPIQAVEQVAQPEPITVRLVNATKGASAPD
jgi:hypothetical protein